MKKVLILGASGMLGSMCFTYLKNSFDVRGTVRGIENTGPFDESNIFLFNAAADAKEQLQRIYTAFDFDYVVNCIGVIKPYCKDDDMAGVRNAIIINSHFPHILSESVSSLAKTVKIIQIATDCVFRGNKGFYTEDDSHDAIDVYGKTKSLGEVIAGNLLNIRCSIIGPELKAKVSLLEWFLKQPSKSELRGFQHHTWNGVTTLQFAEFCGRIIAENLFEGYRELNHVIHYVPNTAVNKYELLNIFNQVFDKNHNIVPQSGAGEPIYRTLSTKYLRTDLVDLDESILNLSRFMRDNGISSAPI